MPPKTVCAALLAAFLAGGVLTGCSQNTGHDAGPATAEGGGAPAQAQREDSREPEQGAAGGAGRQDGQQVKIAPDDRAVIHEAALRVQVDDAAGLERAAERAKQMVTEAGGHVHRESTSGDARRAELTFKIPVDRYPATLQRLAGELGRRLSLTQQVEDVTEEVADVDSRVRSAEATLASLRKLMQRANTVGEVISVEREIAQRQADLEALQARQKALRGRTAHATVTLTLVTPSPAETEKKTGPGGFLGGLRMGWTGLVTLATGVAVLAGLLLPFVPVIAVIAVVALGVRRRLRARRTGG